MLSFTGFWYWLLRILGGYRRRFLEFLGKDNIVYERELQKKVTDLITVGRYNAARVEINNALARGTIKQIEANQFHDQVSRSERVSTKS